MKKRTTALLPAAKREFKPTCGKCDNGWLYSIEEQIRYFDGKRFTRIVYGPSGVAPGGHLVQDLFEDDQGNRHRFYSCAQRCPCTKAGVTGQGIKKQNEPLEPMPENIRDTSIGTLIKTMPDKSRLLDGREWDKFPRSTK